MDWLIAGETTATVPTFFQRDEQPAAVPLWREVLAPLEWLVLRTAPVFYGCGVPRGDGSAVVVVPGFLGRDGYLLELYWWLGRIGYRPYLSRIGWNADCFDMVLRRLADTIDTAQQATGGKVHLVGHSLGGTLSRAAAVRWPERIASVITMGSPFRGSRAHPLVLQMVKAMRERIRSEYAGRAQPECFSWCCGCETVDAAHMVLPSSVPHTAIYTKTDGVADWRFCIHDDPDRDFEVMGTHVGLAFNPGAYRRIAEHLATATRQRPANAMEPSPRERDSGAGG
jgi:pimeloyl-ACP methyl ester carboxylesterase